MEYVLAVLSVIIIVLCIIIIVQSKNKNDNSATDFLEQIEKELSNSLTVQNAKIDSLQTTVLQSFSTLNNDIRLSSEKQSEKLSDFSIRINDLVSTKLNEIAKQNSEINEKLLINLQNGLDSMTRKNDEKLEQMRLTVDEKLSSTLTSRLDTSFKSVGERLQQLYTSLGEMKELNKGVTTNVESLNKVLTNVKARGTWAEYQLETILDQTVPNMYVKSFKPSNNSGYVEFALKIPSGDTNGTVTFLPIDSKFPMEDYSRLCDATDEGNNEEISKQRKALESRVISEAKTVSKYINQPETTPFAILYLATEGLYAEIASSKNALLEKLQNDYSILVAGPTTITALLNSLAMGFRTIKINEKADEIKEILAAIKKQYKDFNDILTTVKTKINDADKALEKGLKRNDLIRAKLKKIDELDEQKANEILEINTNQMSERS